MIDQFLHFLERNSWLLYSVMVLFTLVTLGLTLSPTEKLGDSALYQYDKLGHALLFGTWTLLLGLILLISDSSHLSLLAIFIAGSLFGITVEILQEVLPVDRNMDLYDAVADIAGCLVAVGILKLITSYSSYGWESTEQMPSDNRLSK